MLIFYQERISKKPQMDSNALTILLDLKGANLFSALTYMQILTVGREQVREMHFVRTEHERGLRCYLQWGANGQFPCLKRIRKTS